MRSIAFVAFAVVAVSASATNLVVNGSFESPVVAGSQNDGSALYQYDFTSMAPWTGGNLLVLRNRAPFWVGTDGEQFINLQHSGIFQIGQDLNTVVGQQYRISFDLAADIFAGSGVLSDCTVGVKWNGQTIGTYTPSSAAGQTLTWDSISLNLTASSNVANLSLYDVNNNVNFTGPLLDNVRAEAVPEPTTLLVLGLGLGAAAIRRRR